MSDRHLLAEKWSGLRGKQENQQTSNGRRRRSGGGLGVNDNGSRTSVKSSVGQIDVRQHYDQQHSKKHAEKDAEARRFEVPPRHDLVLLTEF